MANLYYGSSGSDVKKLQQALNSKGYNLSVDGQFGSNTLSAVKDYQKKSGLSVDGIVGVNTWGKLNTASSTATATKSTATKAAAAPATTLSGVGSNTQSKLSSLQKYTPSSDVNADKSAYLNALKNKPASYSSKYDQMIQDAYNKIMNRQKFSYDINGDALYQQYKNSYVTQGQQAMADTVGQAAGLTGGYGNSYGQTAGQQAYQGYLQNLNDKIPALYQAAYDRYQDEGTNMQNNLSLLRDMDSTDYNRYRDKVSDYQNDRNAAFDVYNSDRNYDYGKFSDDRSYWQNQASAENSDYWKKTEFNESKREFDAQYAAAQAAAAAKSSSSSSSSSRRSSGSSSRSYSSGHSSSSSSSSSAKKTSSVPNTYDGVVSALEKKGVGNAAGRIMTATEWTSRKNAGGTSAGLSENSYADYLKDIYDYLSK